VASNSDKCRVFGSPECNFPRHFGYSQFGGYHLRSFVNRRGRACLNSYVPLCFLHSGFPDYGVP
jgi:hypothetical protein